MLDTNKSAITKRKSNFLVFCKLNPQDENNQRSSSKRIKRDCSHSPNKVVPPQSSSSQKNTSYLPDNNYCVFSSLDDYCKSVVFLKNPIKGHLIERYFKKEKDQKTYKDSLFNHSKYFNFDRVFKPFDNNYTIFKRTLKNLVNECVKSKDCSYVVFGPKNSGKNDILIGNGNGMICQAYDEMTNLIHITKQAGNFNECVSMITVSASCIYSGKLYDLFTNKPVEKSSDLKKSEVIDCNDLFTYLKYFKNYGKILGNLLKDANFKRKSISIFSLSYVFTNKAKNVVIKKHAINFLKSSIDLQNLDDEMIKKFRDMLINVGVCSNEHINNLSSKNKLNNLLASFLSSENFTNIMLTIKTKHQNHKVNKKQLDFSQTIRDCVQHSIGNTSANMKSLRSIDNTSKRIRSKSSKTKKDENSIPREKNQERISTEKSKNRSKSNQREPKNDKVRSTIIDTQTYKDLEKDKNQLIATAVDDVINSIHEEINKLYEQAILSKKIVESNYETFCEKVYKLDKIMRKINYRQIMADNENILVFYKGKLDELLSLTLSGNLEKNNEVTSNYEYGVGKNPKSDDFSEAYVGKDNIYIKNEIMLPGSCEKGESAIRSRTGINEDAATLTKHTVLYNENSNYNDKASLYKNIEMEIMSLKNDIIANIEEDSIKKIEKTYASNHKKSAMSNNNKSCNENKDIQNNENTSNIDNIIRDLRSDSMNSNIKNVANNQNSISYRKDDSNSYNNTGSYTIKSQDEVLQERAARKKEDFYYANKEQLERLQSNNVVEKNQGDESIKDNKTEISKLDKNNVNFTENDAKKHVDDLVNFEGFKNYSKGLVNYESGFSFNSPLASNNLPIVFQSPLINTNSELESYRLKMFELETQVKSLETVKKELDLTRYQNTILQEENNTVAQEYEILKQSFAKKESDLSTKADDYYKMLQETVELKGLQEAELKGKFLEKDNHIEILLDQFNEIKTENEDLKSELKQMREMQFNLENTNLILQTKIDKAAERHNDELNDHMAEKDRIINRKSEKISCIKTELNKLETENKALKLTNTDLVLSLERSSNARQYKIDTDSLKRTISECRQELIMKDKEIELCKTQINDLKDEKSKLEIKRHELLTDLRESNKQDKFQQELRLEEMKKEQSSKDNYIKKLKDQLSKKKGNLQDVEESLNSVRIELQRKENDYLQENTRQDIENEFLSKEGMQLKENQMKANIGLNEKKDELELQGIKENRLIAESQYLKIHLDQKSNFIQQTENQLKKYVDYKNEELVNMSNNDRKELDKKDKLQALNSIKILIAKNREKSGCNPEAANERHMDQMKRTARLIDNAIKKKN